MSNENNLAKLLIRLVGMGNAMATTPPAGQATIVVDATPITPAAFSVELLGYGQVIKDAENAQQLADEARAKLDGLLPTMKSRLRGGTVTLKGMLGASNPALETYTVTPEKQRRKLTGKENVAKAEKSAETIKQGGAKAKKKAAAAALKSEQLVEPTTTTQVTPLQPTVTPSA